MKILITGGTGLIGKALIAELINQHEIHVLTRSVRKAKKHMPDQVHLTTKLPKDSKFDFDIIINLAGEPIANRRWSDSQKEKICRSRWDITENLVTRIKQAKVKPSVFISGSAIGYYGRQPSTTKVTENNDMVHPEFTHEVCRKWESLALQAENDTRVCIIRTGLVLAQQGGAIAKMRPAYKLGLGGPISHGQQVMSWISLADHIKALLFLINNEKCQGVYNLTAPNPISNNEFSQTLAKQLNRPNLFRMPSFVLKLIFGEMSDLLLTGQAVYPEKLLDEGFEFSYPELADALRALK